MFNSQNSQNYKIVKIELVETKSYKDMWLRPYEVQVNHDNLNKVRNVVETVVSNNISNVNNIENLLNRDNTSVIIPSATVFDKAGVINGWGTKRFKVVIVLENRLPNSNVTTINLINGYTDYLGMTINKTIDEDSMQIYINSVKVLRRVVNQGSVSVTNIATFNVATDDFSNNIVNTNILARPDDLVAKHSMLKETTNNTSFVSNLSSLSYVNLVNKSVLNPIGHLATTISDSVDAKLISQQQEYGYEHGLDLQDNIVGSLLSTTPSNIDFYKLLYQIKGVDAKTFTLRDLELIDPHCAQLPRNVFNMDNIGGSMPPEMLTTDTADTYDNSYETRIRVLIHEYTDKIMNDNNLNTITFDINNINGNVDMLILNSTSIIPDLDLQHAEGVFKTMFIQQAWPSISNNNYSMVKITVSHMVTDVTIALALDGRPNVIYRDPIFADSKYMPLIVNNDLQSVMAENYGEVVDTALNATGNVLNTLNKFNKPLDLGNQFN